jgi:hypothetical protein
MEKTHNNTARRKTSKRRRVILLLCCFSFLVLISGTFFYQSRGELSDLIRVSGPLWEVESECGAGLHTKSVTIDDDTKIFKCYFEVIDTYSPDTCNKIRMIFNDYFTSHPDYFANDGYIVEIIFSGINLSHPFLIFSNVSWVEDEFFTARYDKLTCIYKYISGGNNQDQLSNFSNYNDIQFLQTAAPAKDDSFISQNFTDLEGLHLYLCNSVEYDKIESIRKIIPDCIIKVSDDILLPETNPYSLISNE